MRLQPIADAFTACGISTKVSGNVQKMIWNKMFTNVSASALTGVLQVPLGFIAQDPHAWNICRILIRETVDVAAALGMEFDLTKRKPKCEESVRTAPKA
jgi:2-dehydropantoate 2-reductase